jgi:hypothetical protein
MRFQRHRPLGAIATSPGAHFLKIDEAVGLTPQFVGDHRRLAGVGGDHFTRIPQRCSAATS